MIKIKYAWIFILCLLTINLNGQEKEEVNKTLKATRIKTPVSIDADLSDKQWNNLPRADSFLQVSPYNGKPTSFNTEVKVA